MPTLLVVDDEPGVLYAFRRVLASAGVEVVTAGTAAEGLALARDRRPDVAVLDLQLPDRDGLTLFADMRALDAKRPVVFVTAHGTTDTAIEAMKRGAFDYLVKPIDVDRVREVVGRALEAARLARAPAAPPADAGPERLVGRSPAMQALGGLIGRVAPQDVNVLILGESGSGKELVARALHTHGRRAERPFLVLNCAAIPEALLESELFGHEAGAFTGAAQRRAGKFEQADGGTLFLDEIGDTSPAVQAKMLRVLQEQRFERLGGGRPVTTDVRVVAATNQDLDRLAAEGRFRADLLYRLRVVTVAVPPLRERPGDVAELARHFLGRFSRELGLDYRDIEPEALALLERHPWPGNVRELRSAIQEAMVRGPGPLLRADALPPSVRGVTPPPAAGGFDLEAYIDGLVVAGESDLYAKVVQEVERRLFARVLRATRGHQAQASDRLGLNRSTLRAKLRELGMGAKEEG